MINLHTGSMYDLLPPNFKDDDQVKAACYAMDMLIERVFEKIQRTATWSHIKGVPEDIADYLAAELRTPFYDASLPLETKQTMVANTLEWYSRLGTKEVIEEIIQLVFGTGELTEWFEYGGRPYTFRVKTNVPMTENSLTDFMQLLMWVKNTRSHLDKLTVEREKQLDIHVATSLQDKKQFVVSFDRSTRIGGLYQRVGVGFNRTRRHSVLCDSNQTQGSAEVIAAYYIKRRIIFNIHYRRG